MGVFAKGTSSHTSSLFLVKRPGKAPRLVVDLRRNNLMFTNVNKSTHTLKSFCESFGRRKNTSVTVFDLKSAFHSICLTEDSKQYVGVNVCQNSPSIVFQRLPMGGRQCPGIFNTIVQYILEELPPHIYHNSVLNYFDDLLLFDSSEEEHLATLDAVFSVLARHGLTISLPKARFAPKHGVKFLGFYIDLQCVDAPKLRVLKSRVQDIEKLARPKSRKQVKLLTGISQYLASFIEGYHRLASPLYELLKKNKNIVHDDI